MGERSVPASVPSRGRVGRLSTSRRPRQEGAQADQVVRRRGEGHDPIDEGAAAMAQLSQPAHRLHPAEDLLDQLPFLLADGIARVARDPAVK